MAQYKTGTVSVTNGSATVTGSGTLWSGEIAAGDLFTIVGDNAWYEVASVGSNTSITLSANYAGTTGSGKSYAISRDFTTRLALPYPQKGDIETASIIKRAFEQIDTETNIATANYSATSAPTANDDSGDGYSIGSWWVNVTSDEAYLCVDATVGAAVWTKISVDVPSEIVSLLNNQSLTLGASTIEGLTIGKGAGAVSTNTAVGASALAANTSGGFSVAVGYLASTANTSGARNSSVGYGALRDTTTGSDLSAAGYGALIQNTTGSNNTAFGASSLFSNTTASNNTAVGYQSLYSNTTGTSNDAFGFQALYANTTANGNSAFGRYSLFSNTTGALNVAMGTGAVQNNTTGSNNTGLGYQALLSNTTASNNTAVGFQAGYSIQTQGFCTFLGYQAGYGVVNNGGMVAIGYQAGYATGSNQSVFVGVQAGYAATGGYNTFVGAQGSGGAGSGSAVTTGSKNTILGAYSGNQGGLDIRTSSGVIVLSDGDGNPVMFMKTGQTVALEGANSVSGTGINFPATQNASSDANTLDDYEEGNWTATLTSSGGGSATLTSTAKYIKIGNLVFVSIESFAVNISGLSAGNLTITGIPFNISSAAPSLAYFDIAGAVTAAQGRVVAYGSVSTILLYLSQSTSFGITQIAKSDLNNSISLRFNGTYTI